MAPLNCRRLGMQMSRPQTERERERERERRQRTSPIGPRARSRAGPSISRWRACRPSAGPDAFYGRPSPRPLIGGKKTAKNLGTTRYSEMDNVDGLCGFFFSLVNCSLGRPSFAYESSAFACEQRSRKAQFRPRERERERMQGRLQHETKQRRRRRRRQQESQPKTTIECVSVASVECFSLLDVHWPMSQAAHLHVYGRDLHAPCRPRVVKQNEK